MPGIVPAQHLERMTTPKDLDAIVADLLHYSLSEVANFAELTGPEKAIVGDAETFTEIKELFSVAPGRCLVCRDSSEALFRRVCDDCSEDIEHGLIEDPR